MNLALDSLSNCPCTICEKCRTDRPGTIGNRFFGGGQFTPTHPPGRPSSSKVDELKRLKLEKPVKRCEFCFSITGRGINHGPDDCTLEKRRQNLADEWRKDPTGERHGLEKFN